jgi:hypothetical protein
MMRRLLLLLLLAVSGLGSPSGAVACTCARSPIDRQVDSADYVFTGLVVDVDTVGALLMATIRVDEVWKGDVTQRFEVWTRWSSAGCGYNDPWARFEIGERFLLFAYDPAYDMEEIFTYLCTRNAKVANATADLAFLGRGTEPLDMEDWPLPSVGPVYPNPAVDRVTIPFALDHLGWIELTVHDLTGREVARLASGGYRGGNHEVTWNTAGMPAGIYLCVLKTLRRLTVRHLVLVR